MEVTSPQKDFYKIAERYKTAYDILFWGSLAFTVLFTFFEQSHIINSVSIFSLVGLVVLDYVIRHYGTLAEDLRRQDFFDNSFGTNYNHEPSKNYYDTDELDNSLYKMITNTFESALFSAEISKRMKNRTLVKNLLFSVVIIGIAIYGFSRTSYALPMLQLFLSKDFIVELIDINVYHSRVCKIFNDIKRLFDNNLVNTSDSIDGHTPEIIKLYMEYETNISDMKVALDSKIYSKLNGQLTAKWEDMKTKYGIK